VENVSVGSKQIKDAEDEMSDVVTSVQLVAYLLKEISTATDEQSTGIGEINQAIIQVDEVTQQNAALVEQAAAAAEAMQEQANALSVAVSVFKLDGARAGARTIVAKPAIAPLAAPAKTAPRKQRKLIKAKENKDGDWKEF